MEPNKALIPGKDKGGPMRLYGASVNPGEGSVWGSTPGSPGGVERINSGANPTETALAEYYELPWKQPKTPVYGYSPRDFDIESNGMAWAPLAAIVQRAGRSNPALDPGSGTSRNAASGRRQGSPLQGGQISDAPGPAGGEGQVVACFGMARQWCNRVMDFTGMKQDGTIQDRTLAGALPRVSSGVRR